MRSPAYGIGHQQAGCGSFDGPTALGRALPPGKSPPSLLCYARGKGEAGILSAPLRLRAETMATLHLVPDDIQNTWEVHEWRNAAGVLRTAKPGEWDDVVGCLRSFRFKTEEVVVGGGNRSVLSRKFDGYLAERGWKETQFHTSIKVDQAIRESPTHKVDNFKNGVGLELEWNNKDPFYDRDLNNFRLLFELRVVEVGIIVTRCSHLQAIFDKLGKGSSYGPSTTHMDKLLPRLEGGGGGGCPILVFGMSDKLYDETLSVDEAKAYAKMMKEKAKKAKKPLEELELE